METVRMSPLTINAKALQVLLAHCRDVEKLDLAVNQKWEPQLETFVQGVAPWTSSLKTLDLSETQVEPCTRELQVRLPQDGTSRYGDVQLFSKTVNNNNDEANNIVGSGSCPSRQ
eukprot:3385876-Amphidinium_carterae.1